METKKAELFKVLGVDTRIRIIEMLKQKGPVRCERDVRDARSDAFCRFPAS